jgi:formylglycine-generating enzyme required for sulfatase activity
LRQADEVAARIPVPRAALHALRGAPGVTEAEDGAWRLPSTELQWHHDALVALIAEIEALFEAESGPAASVRERLAFASTVEERSLLGSVAAARWREAVASISDPLACPAYEGFLLRPQLGLLPLHRDPGSGLWEFAHLQSGEPPDASGGGTLHVEEETSIVLVLVPGGSFRMGADVEPGSDDYDPQAAVVESPAHEVSLDPYFLSKYVMTQGQWLRATGINPSYYSPEKVLQAPTTLAYPVETISWNECRRTLERVGLLLPTEAQWEYACRAGTRTPWWTGAEKESLAGAVNLLDVTVQRFGFDHGREVEEWLDDGYLRNSPVDRFRPNPWGFHDMGGNVYQWCRDGWAPYTAPVRPGDGERVTSVTTTRVRRSGSHGQMSFFARSSSRLASPPSHREFNIGVRPARALDP